MNRTVPNKMTLLCVIVLVVATSAHAQSEAGTVAAVVGSLGVYRGGTWQTAGIGVPVFVGDRLRTGANDLAKVVFRDDSILDLAPDTELTLDKQVVDLDKHRFESLVRVAKGKVRAWVSESYRQPRARYEVETPTAIAGVRGTEFIALYDSAGEFSEFVGVADTIEVAGKLAMLGGVIQVGAHAFTRVDKGRFPTAPQPLDDARFRQYLSGLELIGTGRRDGLNVRHAAAGGRLLSAQDLPVPRAAEGAAAGLSLEAPKPFLAEQRSPDIATNTQPLLGYRSTPPGVVPSGGVKVGF